MGQRIQQASAQATHAAELRSMAAVLEQEVCAHRRACGSDHAEILSAPKERQRESLLAGAAALDGAQRST